MPRATLPAFSLAALLIGCVGSESSPPATSGAATSASSPNGASTPSPPPASASAAMSPDRRAALEDAAMQVVRFLAREAKLDTLALADTVELHLPAEATGTTAGTIVRLTREALRDRDAWRIRVGNRSFSLMPPNGLTRTTVREGTHFNCRETTLASRAPALAAHAHVGVRLEPPESKSCLDGWNATFVFDTTGARPRLVAALYDQWEW